MNIRTYTVEQLRPRIIRAIKNGNNERKYIEEACKAEYSWMQFNEAMRQLEKEGVIKYNDLLEGYYLINPEQRNYDRMERPQRNEPHVSSGGERRRESILR